MSVALKVGVLTVLLLLPSCTLLAAGQLSGQWSVAETRYSPREKAAGLCRADGSITLFAGKDNVGKLHDLWRFNVSTKTWGHVYTGGELTPRDTSTLGVASGELYSFGGQDSEDEQLRDLWVLDDEGHWQQVPVTSPTAWPRRRYRHQSVTFSDESGFFVLFGASGGNFYNDVWRFTGGSWTRLHDGKSSTAPTARFDPCCKYVAEISDVMSTGAVSGGDGAIVCFGGTDIQLRDTNDVWVFFLRNNTWSQITTGAANAPPIRRLALCDVIKREFVVWSGYSQAEGANMDGANLFALNLVGQLTSTHTWRTVAQPAMRPTPRDSAIMCTPSATSATTSTGSYLLAGTDIDLTLRNDLWWLNPSTMQFELVLETNDFPEERAEHNALMVGDRMIVLFGQTRDKLLTDVWALNTTTDTWTLLDRACPYGGRRAAAAVASGNSIWILGGITSSGISSTVITYDLVSGEWHEYTHTINPPPPTYHHSVISEGGVLIQIAGTILVSGEPKQTAKAYVFDPSIKSWSSLPLVTEVPSINGYALPTIPTYMAASTATETTAFPARRSASVVHNPMDGSIWIVGGVNDVALADRYTLVIKNLTFIANAGLLEEPNATSVLNSSKAKSLLEEAVGTSTAGDASLVAVITNRTSLVSGTGGVFSVVRGEAAVVSVGGQILVCGGTVSDRFPTPTNQACYQYSTATGYSVLMSSPPPILTYYSSAVYFGSTVYVFGGNYIRNSIKQATIFVAALQKFKFDTPCLSDVSSPTDDTCAMCSTGSLPPVSSPAAGCSSAPAGSYRTFVDSRTNPDGKLNLTYCFSGQFSPTVGASSPMFCLPCPVGTYNPSAESNECIPCGVNETCEVGSSSPDEKKSTVTARNAEVQPPPFNTSGIPIIPVLIIGIGWFVMCLSTILSARGESIYRRNIAQHYLTDKVNNDLREFFRTNAPDESEGDGRTRGFKSRRLLHRVSEFAELHDMRFPKDGPVLDDMTQEDQDELLRTLLHIFNKFGTSFLTFSDFRLAFCHLISLGKLAPVPGSEFEKDTSNQLSIGPYRWSFRRLDNYEDKHSNAKLGEASRKQKTISGGVVWLVAVITIAAICALLILLFFVDNLEETRSTLSSVAIPLESRSITSTITIDIFTNGAAESTGCIAEGTTNSCANSPFTFPNASIIPLGLSNAHHFVTCAFQAPSTCVMSWICEECSIVNSTASLSFIFAHPSWYASEIVVEVTATSGVDDWQVREWVTMPSKLRQVFRPTKGNVFKGQPSTAFHIQPVSTRFTTPTNVASFNHHDNTGYHLKAGALPTSGNEASITEFPVLVGVPVDIVFSLDSQFLVIARFLKKDFVQLGSSLLGVVSGVGVIAVLILQIVDSLYLWRATKDKAEVARYAVNEASPTDGSPIDDVNKKSFNVTDMYDDDEDDGDQNQQAAGAGGEEGGDISPIEEDHGNPASQESTEPIS